MISVGNIIGKTIEEARSMSAYIIRVVRQDGEHVYVSQEECRDRINVSIINDKIDEVLSIG